MRVRRIVSKFLPKKVKNLRHKYLAWQGAKLYGNPSEELLVIGVTGTSGKSSTVYFLRQVLEQAGFTVGSLSTIDFYIAGEDKLNDQKMTMLGRSQIQKYMREMVEKGCNVAIIETTSEGAVQHRHEYINYDAMIVTNLYPEHIESHGSFENYKNAKLSVLQYIARSKRKVLNGEPVPKRLVVNGNARCAEEFIRTGFDEKSTYYASEGMYCITRNCNLVTDQRVDKDGIHFAISEHSFSAPMFGRHNIMNLSAIVSLGELMGIDWKVMQDAISHVYNAPGRIEFIKESKKFGFDIIIDYAFEPIALQKLYDVVQLISPKRIIHICGAAGGGRDIARREPIGKLVGEQADIVIVTNEDPYDDDPMMIIEQVAQGAIHAGKKVDETVFMIKDRQEAINKAVSLAKEGDIILITGKGSEQAIVEQGELLPWDDRVAARKAIANK